MPKLPPLTGSELLNVLQTIGFEVTRQRGSHVQVRRANDDGTVTTFPVPVHAGKAIKKGTLRGILRLAGLTIQDLDHLL